MVDQRAALLRGMMPTSDFFYEHAEHWEPHSGAEMILSLMRYDGARRGTPVKRKDGGPMPSVGALGCDQPLTEFSTPSGFGRRMGVVFHVYFWGEGGEGGATVGAMGVRGVRMCCHLRSTARLCQMQVLLLAILPILLPTRFYDAHRRILNESIWSHEIISTTYKYAPTLVPSAHSTRQGEIRRELLDSKIHKSEVQQ